MRIADPQLPQWQLTWSGPVNHCLQTAVRKGILNFHGPNDGTNTLSEEPSGVFTLVDPNGQSEAARRSRGFHA